MPEKNFQLPAIVWLKVTDYMHGWLQYELGGSIRMGDKKVISVQHLSGARDILRMETEMEVRKPVGLAVSATWWNCIEAGMTIDRETVERVFGLTHEDLELFEPIECPKICLTKDGVLRPWTNDVCFSKRQAAAMQQLLRDAFWQAVEQFDRSYAQKMEGKKYPAVDMIESFCAETKTPDLFVAAIRREWQRRQKRQN